ELLVAESSRETARSAMPLQDPKVVLKNEADLAKFQREVRLQRELSEIGGFLQCFHAALGNAVEVPGISPTPKVPYLIIQLVPGGTLRDRLARGPLSIEDAVRLGTRLAEAIGRAHEKGLIHRDLKPENVLFTQEGDPLVSDFGLAKHFDRRV